MSAMVVGALGTLASPASAALSAVGPIDPATNFPAYYTDTNGLSLDLCLGLPNCLADTDLVAIHEAGGDAEAFYYSADASTAHFTVHLALEAAYAADGPNQEVVFQRTQLTARQGGLVANGLYNVTDPYGSYTCRADAGGFIVQNACRIETTPVEREFNRPLSGRQGPFLTRAVGQPAPPAGYIGDSVTETLVQGSPTGFNSLLVQGPGLTGTCTAPDGSTVTGCEQTSRFALQGRIADTGVPAASVSQGTLDFGDVPRTPAVTKSLTYANTGALPVTIGSIGIGAGAFSQTNNCPVAPASLASGATCAISVTFTPQPGVSSAGTLTITDNTPAATRTVALKGSNLGVMTAFPTSVTFPDQPINSTSAPDNVVVGNSGNGPLTLTSATITGASSSQFAIPAGGNGCTAAVEPDGGCEVSVTFRPTTTGGKTATLRLLDSTGTVILVPLSGRGVTAPPPPGDTTAPTAVTLAGSLAGTTASLSWNAATDNVGVTAYRVFRNGTQVGADIAPTAARTFTDASLAPGTYNYTVRAVDAAGNFSVSNTRTLTVGTAATVPGVPTIGTAVAGNASATVSWAAPGDGGSPITDYRVQVRTGTTVVRTITVLDETLRSTTVTNLTNGTAYNFRVRAANAVGVGTLSTPSNTVTPAGATTTAPARPVIGTAVAGTAGGAVTATAVWSQPTTGGVPASFTVRAFRVTATGTTLADTASVAGTARQLVWTTLTAGNYRFSVQAVNSGGSSTQSVRSNQVAAR